MAQPDLVCNLRQDSYLYYKDCNCYEKDVVFTGRLSDKDLGEVLKAAYAMVYIPYFEGFGLPVIEAQSCKTPVITSNTSSLPEVLGKGGLLVDPFDEQSITSAILKITSNKELYASLVDEAVKNVERFHWDKTAELFWESVEKGIEHANI